MRLLASAFVLPLSLLLSAGCDEPAPAKKKVQTREILNQRTQDIRDAPKEIKSGAAVPAPKKPIARDPITLVGNTYVTAIGRTSIDNMKHAVDLFQASEGRYPKDYNEFMERIIKENNIALPKLPYYQEYAYDAAKHELQVIEYPDKKDAGPGK